MFLKIVTLYSLCNISTLLFLTYFFTGFKITESAPGYFLGFAIVLSLINYFIDPLIKFFTLKIKFLTIWLFIFLITLPLLYIIKFIIPGIEIKNGVFRTINFGVFQINSFQMNDLLTIIIAAVLIGFSGASIRWLMEQV